MTKQQEIKALQKFVKEMGGTYVGDMLAESMDMIVQDVESDFIPDLEQRTDNLRTEYDDLTQAVKKKKQELAGIESKIRGAKTTANRLNRDVHSIRVALKHTLEDAEALEATTKALSL